MILYFNVGMKPHQQVKEEMDRFMREVAPHFQGKHCERRKGGLSANEGDGLRSPVKSKLRARGRGAFVLALPLRSYVDDHSTMRRLRGSTRTGRSLTMV